MTILTPSVVQAVRLPPAMAGGVLSVYERLGNETKEMMTMNNLILEWTSRGDRDYSVLKVYDRSGKEPRPCCIALDRQGTSDLLTLLNIGLESLKENILVEESIKANARG